MTRDTAARDSIAWPLRRSSWPASLDCMIEGIGREQIVYFGFSKDLFGKLSPSLPAKSVLVVEEPDVVRKRDLRAAAARSAAHLADRGDASICSHVRSTGF